MRTLSQMERRSGFTVWELLCIAVCLFILAVLLLPVTERLPEKSKIERCRNNLKQIGLEFSTWAHDHEDGNFPIFVSTNKGGTLEYQESDEVFRHYQILSNYLDNPRVFVCPADTQRTPAQSMSSNFRNDNVSYFISLNSLFLGSLETAQNLPRLGDRNITGGFRTNHLMLINSNSPISWTSEMHNQCGNVLGEDCSTKTWRTNDWRSSLKSVKPFRVALP